MYDTANLTATLWLVRHGQSEQNVRMLQNCPEDKTITDWPDHAAPLTKLGVQQAHDAGAFLADMIGTHNKNPEKTIIFASPYVRTQQTAQEIQALMPNVHIITDDMLVEMDFGMFDGVLKSELPDKFEAEFKKFNRDRQHHGKFFARRPNGESPLDVSIRQRLFISAMDQYLMKNPMTKHVIIIGHGAQLTVLQKVLLHKTHTWYEAQLNPGNASIQKISMLWQGQYISEGYAYGKPGENEAED